MKDNSLFKLGGACAILLGIIDALSGITYLLLPADQRLGVPASRILPSITQGAPLLKIQLLELAFIGILGLIVVPAFSELFKSQNEGWVRWIGNLALVGFAVAAVSNLLTFARLPAIATAFAAGDAATKAALVPVWRSTLDLYGIWNDGVIGVWILTLSLLALRGTIFPRILAVIGVLAGIFLFLIPLAFFLKTPSLFPLAAILGGIASTIWMIWSGVIVRQAA
ncbi:MAG: DUF4386 family protein [Anaerolineales bacterium]|jgi:hypothetical protein